MQNGGDQIRRILYFSLLALAVTAMAVFASSCAMFVVEEISLDELEELIQKGDNSIIFCTQETCSGCKAIEPIVKKLAKEIGVKVYAFDLDTQEAKEFLYQYGLNQVPAIIKISDSGMNIYKGTLTEEDIRRALATETIVYERFNSIVAIKYSDYLQKKNENIDFFVYFGSELCSDCIDFHQVLEQFFYNNPKSGVYYVDLDSEEEYQKIIDENYIEWIPIMLHIKNGVELSSYEYPSYAYRQEKNHQNIDSQAALDFIKWFENELK